MSKPAINFIQKRKLEFPRRFMSFFSFRASSSLLVGAFLVLAGLGAGVFYLMKFQGVGPFAEKPKSQGQVAGVQCEVTGQLPKDWLKKYFNTDNECDPAVGGAEGDPDDDGLLNLSEVVFGTDPTNLDTDGDGHLDGLEVGFNRNPNGEGTLDGLNADELNYEALFSAEDKQQINQFEQTLNQVFQPDRQVVLDLPGEGEFIITQENNREGFEKYYEATKGLKSADQSDLAKVENDLFEMKPDEIDAFIAKTREIIKTLNQTPVPSEITGIHQLKIAQLRAGIRMFELVRDTYEPTGSNDQFWSDYSYQMLAGTTAAQLEDLAWMDVFDTLREMGGL